MTLRLSNPLHLRLLGGTTFGTKPLTVLPAVTQKCSKLPPVWGTSAVHPTWWTSWQQTQFNVNACMNPDVHVLSHLFAESATVLSWNHRIKSCLIQSMIDMSPTVFPAEEQTNWWWPPPTLDPLRLAQDNVWLQTHVALFPLFPVKYS